MKLSIIVPCYNSERFIAKTMDSLLKQSYQDFKVIAIDDGSSDNTLDILKEYAQKDARVQVYHKKMVGLHLLEIMGYLWLIQSILDF